jgi:hypothetical protein
MQAPTELMQNPEIGTTRDNELDVLMIQMEGVRDVSETTADRVLEKKQRVFIWHL